MSLTPAFEIGLWNAWIFMLLYLLVTYAPAYLINRQAAKRAFSAPPYNKTEKLVSQQLSYVTYLYTRYSYSIA